MSNDTIRVLQVIRHMNVGGAETFIMNIYRNIDREKVQFDFLVNGKGFFDEEIRKMGGKIYYINYLTEVGQRRYKKELEQFFLSHKEYNTIHSHIDQVSGIILEAAKKCGIKNRIAHSHNTKNSNSILGKIYKKYLQSKICKNATNMFACGKKAAKWLYRKNSDKAVIINNGINIEKFKYSIEKRKNIRNELNVNDDTVIIGHVGRFNKVKNQKYLIKIYKQYLEYNENSLLIFIGDGPLKERIEKMTKKLKIENNVKFLGIRQDVDSIYSAMDYFVFPSLFEGLSVALIEAQTSGVKVLASDTIDKDSDISNNIQWISIKQKPIIWSQAIKNTNKIRNTNIAKAKEYDIKIVANQLQETYILMEEKK